MAMESSVSSSFAKTGQALADKAAAKRGLDAITDMTSQARDIASNTSDSIVSFTKKNPVASLAIAAASGALIYATVKALKSSRD
jgi:hypothetical protein